MPPSFIVHDGSRGWFRRRSATLTDEPEGDNRGLGPR